MLPQSSFVPAAVLSSAQLEILSSAETEREGELLAPSRGLSGWAQEQMQTPCLCVYIHVTSATDLSSWDFISKWTK